MNLFGLSFNNIKTKDSIAKILKTDKKILKDFEDAYAKCALVDKMSDNFFEINSRQMAQMKEGIIDTECSQLDDIINRIVDELLGKTVIFNFDGKTKIKKKIPQNLNLPIVTNEEICKLPEELRPQLTGSLCKVDINEPSYVALLSNYEMYKKETNIKKKQSLYGMFRQGLDILDIDPITYEMIGMNPNSMGYWLPSLIEATIKHNFFKIPKTTIIKVPISVLQLTRLDYSSLTRTTLDIVDKFCQKVFNLDENEDYFIKTGTYSSKYDFRNARVYDSKEIRELGEYLLFIHYQACQMASSLNNCCIYGVSTTNEWVVREFIKDKENNPCIYKGLPLHTEYRVFVDFDTKQVLGVNPYWDPNVMKQRFGNEDDSDKPDMTHDYIIYTMHEDILMKRYNENVDKVIENIQFLLNDIECLCGQWSIDIMQNGEDFWIIDMALAINSALNECVPKGLLKPIEENWIPKLDDIKF